VLAATSAPVALGRPIPVAELGRPVALAEPAAGPVGAVDAAVAPVSFQDSPRLVVRGQSAEAPPPPPPPPPGRDAFNPAAAGPVNQGWWDRWKGWFDFRSHEAPCSRGLLESDHAFDFLISPVSSPFFAEDPRSLTELRPLFFYQYGPNNPNSGHS